MSEDPQSPIKLTVEDYGVCLNEKEKRVTVKKFTWQNDNHLEIQLTNYGATIISIKYPDKFGIVDDIIWGFDNLKSYKKNKQYYIGSTIGRYANIVSNSKFTLSKKEYKLKPNLGDHHFNGGSRGFHQMVWHYELNKNAVVLTHFSPHNHDGYPGHLIIKATFELLPENEFRIEYRAITTKQTIINVTNNCYFNLAGHFTGAREIKRHKLLLKCDKFIVTENDHVPTGYIKSVEKSIYDFTKSKSLDSILEKYGGTNRNFCVIKPHRSQVILVAQISHPVSGRVVDIYSNQPSVQVNTATSFPERPDGEDDNVKRAKCQHLNIGVVTFDILDEIYNEVKRVAHMDNTGDYQSLLELIRELEYKSKYVYKILSCNTSGVPFYKYIKRSAVTLENIPAVELTPLQKKFVTRILHEVKCSQSCGELQKLQKALEAVLENNNEAVDDVRAVASFLDINENIICGKERSKYWKNGALSIQPQNFPDACNHAKFPSCVLTPGKDYVHVIKYKFRVTANEVGLAGIL